MRIELDKTEQKIVEATFNILQKERITKATTKRIAGEAGVNEVTIFRKFTNKKNLIEITKAYYIQRFLGKLEEIFDFTGDEEIGEYLGKNYQGLSALSESDYSIIKIAMEEVRDIPEKKLLISQITSTILDRMEEFFTIKIEKGEIRDVDARVLAIMCFSVIFQANVLWKVYHDPGELDTERYSKNYMDIMFNGIKVK